MLGVDKYEVGVAATAGDDLGQATGGAIGAVICSLLPGAGWAAAGICGAVGSMVINIDTAGDEFTVGLWDERAGGFFGSPLIRIGIADGHTYSRHGLTEQDHVAGYLALADPRV